MSSGLIHRFFSMRVGMLLAWSSCLSAGMGASSTPYDWSPWSSGIAYRPANVLAAPVWPPLVKRVAVLPVACSLGDLPSDYFSAHDPIWRGSLQGSHRAEFVAVSRADLARLAGKASVSTVQPLPPDFLERVAAFSGSDAVAFLEVTSFNPYGSVSIGFRARITEVVSKVTVWAVEDVVHFDETAMAEVVKEGIARRETRSSLASEMSGVRLTPSKAVGYVATAIAKTLPPRKL